jgi:hypothetical protein
MPTGNPYPCREPGCPHLFAGRDTPKNRSDRNYHERNMHSNSPHRVWECPLGCGPTGYHYSEDALRIHTFRCHTWTGHEWKHAYPGIRERRAVLLDSLWVDAQIEDAAKADRAAVSLPPGGESAPIEGEAQNTPQTAPESTQTDEHPVDLVMDPETVMRNLRALLETWQTHEDNLEAAEAELQNAAAQIATLREENEALTQRIKTLEADVSWNNHVFTEIRLLLPVAQGDKGSSSTVSDV